jgi:tetratricopeptide (TPR) repeat protein
VVAVVGVVLSRLKEGARKHDEQGKVLASSIRTTGDATQRPPTVGGTSLKHLGVHQALDQIPYLHRGMEDELVGKLAKGEPVLVLGRSVSGKTRLAAQMVQEHYADRLIIIPDVPGGLADLVAGGAQSHDALIWLDDLDRYIDDPRNLKAKWLEDLIANGNLVVATMREQPYERYRPTGSLPCTQWALLGDFSNIRLVDTDDERQRLAEQSGNAKVSAGISRYGLGPNVGGGPLAVDCLDSSQNQHPWGYALIRAAVDWRRSGIGEVIPQATAELLVPCYVTSRQQAEEREGAKGAIEWATSWETGRDAFRLLAPQDGGWRAFDYLLDHVADQQYPIPEQTWEAIATADAPVGNFNTAGVEALSVGNAAAAKHLFQRAADLGDARGTTNLGVLLVMAAEFEKARPLLEAAIASGDPQAVPMAQVNLGAARVMATEFEKARPLLEAAIASGDPQAVPMAQASLGAVLLGLGEPEKARPLLEAAIASGDPQAVPMAQGNLGSLLVGLGEPEKARPLLEAAIASGNAQAVPMAQGNLGAALIDLGEPEKARPLLEAVVASGNAWLLPISQSNLGAALVGVGEPEKALPLLEAAVASSHPWGLTNAQANLGAALVAVGEPEKARPLLEAVVASGNRRLLPMAQANLGAALVAVGEPEKARPSLEAVVASGNRRLLPMAQTNLGAALVAVGEPEKSRPLLEAVVASGEPNQGPRAANLLRDLLADQDDA